MKSKVISLFVCLLLIVSCFVGCKDTEGTGSDISSDTGTTSSIPVVIVDDEDEPEYTQSELDEILNDWENNNPTINIEFDTDDNSSTNSSFDNSSGDTTSEEEDNNSSNDSSNSSDSQESSDDSSTDNSSDNSSNTDSSDTGSEDDGYFDVAV